MFRTDNTEALLEIMKAGAGLSGMTVIVAALTGFIVARLIRIAFGRV